MGRVHGVIQILSENVPRDHPVYLHSFQGPVELMKDFLQGWPNGYIGLNGCATYWSTFGNHVFSIVCNVPLSSVLLETDGPYMPPEPYSGASTHPGHIPWIAHAVAEAKGMDI